MAIDLLRARVAARLSVPLLTLLAACRDAAAPDANAPAPGRAASAAVAAADAPNPNPKAYALILDPVASAGTTIKGGGTYTAGTSVQLQRDGAGDYRVSFTGLGPKLDGPAHVQVHAMRRAAAPDGHDRCGAWPHLSGSTLVVEVSCRRDRTRTDVPFTVQVFDADAAVAFVSVSSGGASGFAKELSRAVRVDDGEYRVFFRRSPLFGDDAKPIAFVSYGRGSRFCRTADIGIAEQRADELGVAVVCRDERGDLADQEFHVLAFAQTPRTAYALVDAKLGSPPTVVAAHSHNAAAPSGGISVIRSGNVGGYSLVLSALGNQWGDAGTVAVAAYGDTRTTCSADLWSVGTPGSPASGTTVFRPVRVGVQCRGPDGRPKDSPFLVLATTRPLP